MKLFNLRPLLQLSLLLFFCAVSQPVLGQVDSEKAAREARKYMSQGEEALQEGDVSTAEAFYREAISKDPSNATARYNLGNLYYDEEISNEAIQRHSQAGTMADEKSLKHKSFHNQGNSYMDQKKYPEAIEAYKDALRNKPDDEETRYNLALAKKLWEQEKDGGGEDDSENNKDGQSEQEKEQEQQGDQGDQEQDDQGNPQDQQDGDKKDQGQPDENNEGDGEPKKQEEGEGDKKEQQQQPMQQQPQPGQLSPQQVKSLLEAMGNQEKKVQEKMNAEKAQGVPIRSDKDW